MIAMNEVMIRSAAERYIQALAGSPAHLLEQFAPNAWLEDADGAQHRGRSAIAAYVAEWLDAYRSVQFTTERIMIARDQAAVRWKAKGVTATGHRVVFGGISILRLDAAGRITGARQYETGLLAQSA
jgi:ketosteroid isomerase-like protein